MAEASWEEYCATGRARAIALGNRGPMKFDASGRLHRDIIDAYNANGFYVFTGVLDQQEIDELTREFDELLDNAPVARGATIDKHGRDVEFPGYYSLALDEVFRNHQVDGESENEAVVGLVSHPLMMMDSALRVYAHPQIMKMVASINGDDFVPFHESIFHKGAGEGPPTPWHQDGRTHWDETGRALEGSDGSGKTHGFNLSVSWSECTPENCLWVVPGSHKKWLLANDGTFPKSNQRLDDAVPMTLNPGDCGMVSRSSLHGSYPNKSDTRRITMVLGFHKRDSAIGAETTNVHAFRLPGKQRQVKYDTEWVETRARMIALAIDARRQYYPDEEPYEYSGTYLGDGNWNAQSRAEISQEGDEYWQRDITL
ncbi:MAG: hypothetical protein GKR90_17110 [Pseudomonadales bacterium]|nr:hypothetical protein [Pseudomonadales bacterium]